MAERYTLARPYAQAVYELAAAAGEEGFSQWSGALGALAAIVQNDTAAALMHNPRISGDELIDTIIAVGGPDFDDRARNLVRLLVANDRLALAPEIAELFETRRAAAEDRLDVGVTSAVDLDEDQRKALGHALERHFGRNISMNFEQDDAIIGGVVIRADDVVIDGSLTTQLERMRRSLVN